MIIVYIGHIIFGVIAGFIAGAENERENETVAILVFVAMATSMLALIFGNFPHIFGVFFVWLVVTWITSEIIKYMQSH